MCDKPVATFYGWMPNGVKTTIPVPLDGTAEDFDRILNYQNIFLSRGFVLDDPAYGKLEAGEKREKINGILRRKDQKNGDNTTSPTFDLYPDNPALGRRCLIVNLDTPEETAEFEKVTGYKVSDFKVCLADQLNRKEDPATYAEYAKPIRGNVSVVFKDNPAYDPNAAKKKRQHFFVRWEVANATPTPQPPPSQPATPPAASGKASADEARNAELRNEELVITRVEARPDSTGWYGYGLFDDGTAKNEVRVNLFAPEDPKAITDAGYQWVTSGKVQWPVILKIDRNMARIDTVVPVVIPETPQNANLPQSNAKHGQPDTLPSWFETPAKDCWGAIKQYLLNNMYDKNTFHMNGSLDKHGITENKGQKLRDEWVNSSAGSLIKYLSDNRELAAAS